MPRYKAPTIQERGGLKAHMTRLGYDYGLFKLLKELPGQTNSSIAKALAKDQKKGPQAQTVRKWITIDNNETEEALNGKG